MRTCGRVRFVVAAAALVATAGTATTGVARAQETGAEVGGASAGARVAPPGDAETRASTAEGEASAAGDEGGREATEPRATAAPAPKVVVIVVGDPDPVLQAAALELDGRIALAGGLRLPSDPALRAALRGEPDPGAEDDGLDEVRRERRRLGLGEPSDAPILARLGRRAGAVLVVAVREGAAGAEALALDVGSERFFEGTLGLAAPEAGSIETFVGRRARVSARAAAAAAASPGEAAGGEPAVRAAAGATAGPEAATVPEAATQADAEPQQQDWFLENWPYFAAGGLLAAAIVFVVVTATQGGDPPPMLRFQSGVPMP